MRPPAMCVSAGVCWVEGYCPVVCGEHVENVVAEGLESQAPQVVGVTVRRGGQCGLGWVGALWGTGNVPEGSVERLAQAAGGT